MDVDEVKYNSYMGLYVKFLGFEPSTVLINFIMWSTCPVCVGQITIHITVYFIVEWKLVK